MILDRLLLLLASLALLLTTTGCPIVITCSDTGCASGQLCNEVTGLCQDIARDCRTLPICRTGEVCDDATGECRPERLRCTEAFTCPEGQSCNASSGFCERAFLCQSNDDCGVAEQCDLDTQECETRSCENDADCPAAYVCDDDDDECVAGCRPNADGCPAGQFCAVKVGDSIGACIPNCGNDQDCPFGQFCDLTGGADSICRAENDCTVDADCRLDEICSDQNCVQPPCETDDDCLVTQVCEKATRSCRAAECAEDNFGAGPVANHTRQTAFTLDFGDYTQLVLCGGRSDWFALEVRGSDIVRARLAQQPGDPDFDLYVYDEDGNALVSNQQVGVVSSLKFAAGRDQVIYLEVRSVDFDGGNYDLTLSNEVCANDTFEENDSLADATVVPSSVGVPSELALRACGFDEDWFRIRQNDADNGLLIERVTTTADLRVVVLTPDGELFDVRLDQPYRALRSGVLGSTYVRAFGALGQTGDYRLAFEILAPWQCPGLGDHATPATALVATSGATITETLCYEAAAWEVDWIEVIVDTDGLIDLELRGVGDTPPLEAVLWAGDGVDNVLVRPAVSDGDVERLQAGVTADRRWFVRVTSSEAVGRVLDEPRYEIEYVIR